MIRRNVSKNYSQTIFKDILNKLSKIIKKTEDHNFDSPSAKTHFKHAFTSILYFILFERVNQIKRKLKNKILL
jgi:hypothetical protein